MGFGLKCGERKNQLLPQIYFFNCFKHSHRSRKYCFVPLSFFYELVFVQIWYFIFINYFYIYFNSIFNVTLTLSHHCTGLVSSLVSVGPLMLLPCLQNQKLWLLPPMSLRSWPFVFFPFCFGLIGVGMSLGLGCHFSFRMLNIS